MLRDLQERAAGVILEGGRDVILSAATAGGKTEAAFLPIVSRLAADAHEGIGAVYISPLKALINDQFHRLSELCKGINIPVHRWHGDVPVSRKQDVLKGNGGILLITPESLEALFVRRGLEIPRLFAGLRYVVVDELHVFIGTERGKQLQSLMHRLDLAVRFSSPRIALSATLGDMAAAAEFLRPGGGQAVEVIESEEAEAELLLQLRGYVRIPPDLSRREGKSDGQAEPENVADGDVLEIADHLFRHLRGKDNLIFANARARVEQFADLLRRRSERERVPNEFFPHHGNLSKELRETLEAALKADRPVSAVCTSTLELGIDIGSVHSIAQIGPPPSVSSMRQRLGRSGRREGEPAVLRVYLGEAALDGKSEIPDMLRLRLVQTVAMIELLLRRWYEPPSVEALHLSTLVQQFLSLVVQHGGVRAAEAYSALCKHGPFRQVSSDLFVELLRSLGEQEVITQSPDGTLLLGPRGERITGHHSFYAAFMSDEEYRISCEGKTLGTLPVSHAVAPGMYLIFGGRRWKVIDVDGMDKRIEVKPSRAGRPPVFGGEGGFLHGEIMREMFRIYRSTATPVYLDRTARHLLEQGRRTFAQLDLADEWLLSTGSQTLLFPWAGTAAVNALALMLMSIGLEVSVERTHLVIDTEAREVLQALRALVGGPVPPAAELAALVQNKETEKYHGLLTENLLCEEYSRSKLAVSAALVCVRDVVAGAQPKESFERTSDIRS